MENFEEVEQFIQRGMALFGDILYYESETSPAHLGALYLVFRNIVLVSAKSNSWVFGLNTFAHNTRGLSFILTISTVLLGGLHQEKPGSRVRCRMCSDLAGPKV